MFFYDYDIRDFIEYSTKSTIKSMTKTHKEQIQQLANRTSTT